VAARPDLQALQSKLAAAGVACQQTLVRVGPQAQSQALLQAYARVQVQRLTIPCSANAACMCAQGPALSGGVYDVWQRDPAVQRRRGQGLERPEYWQPSLICCATSASALDAYNP
jgi:hypothetical protein